MSIRTSIIVLAALLALAGCGRRGSLESPSGPAAEAAATSGGPSVGGQEPAAAAPEGPERRFILDPLI